MEQRVRRAALVGLCGALVLVAAATALPPLLGWEVHSRGDGRYGVPPLHGYWEVKLGPGTLPALLIAVATVLWGGTVAGRLPWRRLLAASYVVGLGWLLSLALVEGRDGLTHVLIHPYEYLDTARSVTSVPTMLEEYVDRIPFDHPDNWTVHVAGHPPGMVLFFIALVRVGLGGDLAAPLVVVAVAASIPAAVLVLLRASGREDAARAVAPFLVVTPAAIFLAVSADAVIAATVAWGLAALALGARHPLGRGWPWALLAGLLLGYAVLMSYGMPLAGLLAVAVLVVARRWWPLPVAAVAALAVVLTFGALGFAWWEALPVLRERYWDGLAADRPAAYWLWGNLAALMVSAGPVVGAGLGAAWARRRADRVVPLLVAAAAGAIVVADLSLMSKSEVERIWLPFVPWLTVGCALLPGGWQRPALAAQVVAALLVQHLLYTSW